MILEKASAMFNMTGTGWKFWMIDYYDRTGATTSRRQKSSLFTRDINGKYFETDTVYVFAAKQAGQLPCIWAVGFRVPPGIDQLAEAVIHDISILVGHAVYDDPEYLLKIGDIDPTDITDGLECLWNTPAFQNAGIDQLYNN